ncbi:DnaJ-like subfamily C member 13 [Hondaea fermentalgiana]|uniref:DnaJ-like subfamily C member 13 n=1 Tax=Hondaea fermentalgiana TaxID=2315210 RepID=A0A2R5GK18_9STRA|nr:DnaJ-like subfamily C member 13 [Hondaea fermentalgiana]|eukprot:GBG30975.1 DnaJ-like subfamily C member 13 [Hondaea fermentalgiana]
MASKDGVPGPVTHRYVSVKQHKLRGEYLRVFEVGLNGFANVDPGSAQVTNRWRFNQLEEIILPDQGDAAAEAQAAQHGMAQRYNASRTNLLTKTNSQTSVERDDSPAEEPATVSSAGRFQLVLSGEGGALSFGSGNGVVEVADENATRILHAYRYVDMESIQRAEGEAIVFLSGMDRRPRAFATGQHTHAIIASISASVRASAISVAFIDQTLTKEGWTAVARAYERSAASAQTVCEFAVNRRVGPGKQSASKPLLLRITTRHLVELDQSSHQVLAVHSLARVFALVRPFDFDGDFEVLLHSEDQDLEYTLDEKVGQQALAESEPEAKDEAAAASQRRSVRDTLLAHLLDACARRKSRISLLPTKPRAALRTTPRNVIPPSDIEVLYFRRITSLVTLQPIKEVGSPMHNMHLQRVLQACADFTANSTWPMQASSLAQLSSNGDLHGAGAVAFISLAAVLVRADPEKVHPRATLQALEVILRIVDRRDLSGLFNVSVTQTFELASVLTVALEASSDLIVHKGLEILSALLGRGVRDKARDRAAENDNKVALLTPELVDALAAVWRRHAGSALLTARLTCVFEQTLVSGRDSTPENIYHRMRETLLRLGGELVNSLRFRTLETLESAALLLRVALEEPGTASLLESIQEEALRSGALLRELYEAIFGDLDARNFASQCLVHNFTVGNKKGGALLRRVLPAGLISAGKLHVDATARTVDVDGDLAQGLAPPPAAAIRRTALEKRLDLAIHTLRSGHMPGRPLTKEMASGVAHMRRADPLDGVFHVAAQTHETPNLIWNKETRTELQEALRQELSFVSAPGAVSSFSWNYEEFAVNYASLRHEVMAGPAYLRLLLASDEAARQLREPKEVFGALYNQFLKNESPEDSLRAMELVYRCHAPVIGEFADVTYLVDRLARVSSNAIRLLLLSVVRACASSKVNLVSLVLHPTTVASLVAAISPVVTTSGSQSTSSGQEEQEEAIAEDAMRVAEAALALLQELASLQSTTDAHGRLLRPPPRAIRLLCSADVWPELCRAMETPTLAAPVADLLCTVISFGADREVLKRVHRTGLLESALLINDASALVKVACLLDALLPFQRTQLLNFIPESLVCVLERDGPERFAEVYTGSNVSGADVIWTSAMREQVRTHLTQNRGGPTPPVIFDDLEDEYFCNGYYLNRLAPMSPGELDIDNPVSLLEGILELWRTDEGRRKVNGVPQQEARAALGLEAAETSTEVKNEPVDRATLDAAFRTQAAKEDLDARTLSRLQAAYRTLASRSTGGGVSSKLLLQTQALLFQQYKSELHGLAYPALDLLMETLRSEEMELGQAAMRLAHALSAASPRHAVDLAERGAVEVVVNTVDPETQLPLAEGLRCLVLWASLAKSKARVREASNLDKLLKQLLHVLSEAHGAASPATVQSALQVVARLADDESVQQDMYSRGFVWVIMPLLFDAAEAAVSAKHAARALARLGGMLASRELASPRNETVVDALQAALTIPVARLLREPNPSKLLATLNADSVATPTVVWDAAMREQLLAFLVKNPDPESLPELEVAERCVAGLYVRLFAECEEKEAALRELESPAGTALALLRVHESDPDKENLVALAGIMRAADQATLGAIANALILAQPPVIPCLIANLDNSDLRADAVAVLEAFCERQHSLCDAVGSALRDADRVPRCTADATELDLRLLAVLPFQGSAEDVRDLLAIVVEDPGKEASQASPARTELAMRVLQKCPDVLLSLYLPVGVIRSLRKGTLRRTLEQEKVEEPELIWSADALQRLQEAVHVPHEAPVVRVEYPEVVRELCVGGVFVRPFLEEHEHGEVRLEDEAAFLRSLLEAFAQLANPRARATSSQAGGAPPPRPQRRPSGRGGALIGKGAPPPIPSRSRKPSQTAEDGGLKAARPPPPVPSSSARTPSPSPPTIADGAPDEAARRNLLARALIVMLKRCPDEATALSTAGHGPRLVEGLERAGNGSEGAAAIDDYLDVLLALADFDSWAEHLAANTMLDVTLAELLVEEARRLDPAGVQQEGQEDEQTRGEERSSRILDLFDAMGAHLLREEPVRKLLDLIEPDRGALQGHADAVVDALQKTVHPGVRNMLEHDEIWQHYAVEEQV